MNSSNSCPNYLGDEDLFLAVLAESARQRALSQSQRNYQVLADCTLHDYTRDEEGIEIVSMDAHTDTLTDGLIFIKYNPKTLHLDLYDRDRNVQCLMNLRVNYDHFVQRIEDIIRQYFLPR